jgi:hypothetical protein
MTITPRTLRNDLKCGNGAISEGETCHVGKATKVKPKKRTPKASFAEKALIGGGSILAGAGGIAWTGAFVAQAAGLVSKPKKGKDPVIKSQRQMLNAGKMGVARSIAGAAGSIGIGAVGAGLKMRGTRTRDKELQRTGRGLITTGLVGAAAEGLNARDYIEKNKKTVQEAKAWATRKRRSRRARKEFQNFAEEFTRKAEEAAKRARERRAGGRPNTAVADPFKDLGVSESASTSEIRAIWKKRLSESHPDVGGDPELAKKYNAAWQEIKRRRGDRTDIFADGFGLDWENLGGPSQ